ncbi:acidic phospholipase A2 PLA-2-like [Ranitomeya imitator]|uniref:acidic phospholipase A2 PLA-2-like n=1 Tax=Ranitomeya imitator TaxID=111125 RepID=UPI0037E7D05D
MITCLLLLLSLGSVEGGKLPVKNLKDMLKETKNQGLIDALPHSCLCVSSASNQTLEHLERCCALQWCCRKAIRTCYSGYQTYKFIYSNGTIDCSENAVVIDCPRQTCECDRKTVMCLMNPENSEENSEVEKSCYRKLKVCPTLDFLKEIGFGIKKH